jgi:prepilin-type N-terminal cleavage/methylation domain-containing protein
MLRQRIRDIRKNDKGFTLIELLIVIIILGVLAGIVVFAVGAFNDRGVNAACKSDKKIVEVATEAFKAKSLTKSYPASATSTERLQELVDGKFLRELPSTTSGYTITLDADGTVGPAACPA